MTNANIHSIETFGCVDGPGIRFVIFVQGCHMRCRYCHNPDSWSMDKNQEMTADELLDKAERYREYWGAEGGITVSGGEPLLQIDFLTELFSKAKARGISTCLDTSAQPFRKDGEWFARFEELMKYTDTILLDIKHIRPDHHKQLTGWGNDNILDCAKYLSEIEKPVWIRHVLVPGITDDDTFLHELADFLSTLHNIKRIDVLPYHSMGKYKYDNLGIKYTLGDVEPPAEERVNAAKEILGKAL